jgi:2-oxoisovalerate dehydrogenase E1 component
MSQQKIHPDFDWRKIAELLLVSREMDNIEETGLVPQKKVLYQFSALPFPPVNVKFRAGF